MDLKISMFDRDSAPEFVRQTKAEPSNVSSCTPQTKRKQDQARAHSSDASDPARLLFPPSAVKAALPRDRSDTSLSITTEMSHSSISSSLFNDGAPVDAQRKSPRGPKSDSPVAARQTRSQGKVASMENALPVRGSSLSPPLVHHLPQNRRASPTLQAPPGFSQTSMSSAAAVPAALSYRNAVSAASNGYIINPAPRGVPGAPPVGNGYGPPIPPYVNDAQLGVQSMPYGYPLPVSPVPMGAHTVLPPAVGTDGALVNGVLPAPYLNAYAGVPNRMEPMQHAYLNAQTGGEHMMQQMRPMPFPSMPSAMPPARELSASPPKRVRKDGTSNSSASVPSGSGGGSGNSSSSSLDGSNNNKASRKK